MTDLRPSVRTLLHSWGGDTPEEVYWGLNEMAIAIKGEGAIQLPNLLESNEAEEQYEEVYEDFLNQFNLN